MKILFASLLVAVSTSLLQASNWGSVIIPEITLKHPEAQVTVKTSPEAAKLTGIEVILGGEKITIQKTDLTGIDTVQIHTARIVTSYGQGNLKSRSHLKNGFYVVFEFGTVKYHIDEDLERVVPVYASARFHFDSSGFLKRTIIKPAGDYKNKWQLFEKERGKKEAFYETIEGARPLGY